MHPHDWLDHLDTHREAERAVQTVKKLLKTAEDPHIALLMSPKARPGMSGVFPLSGILRAVI